MAENKLDKVQDKILEAVFTGLFAIVGGLVIAAVSTSGPSVAQYITNFINVVGGSSVLALIAVYRHYDRVLASSAHRNGTAKREGYADLRRRLSAGGTPAMIYARRLEGFLNRVDRFFKDAGKANRTLFPHAFGLKRAAPLWTSPSYIQCLLIAMVYPLVTIFLIWAISGHAGPAERALHLGIDVVWWKRACAGGAFACAVLFGFRFTTLRSRRRLIEGAVLVTLVIVLGLAAAGSVSATGWGSQQYAVVAGAAAVAGTSWTLAATQRDEDFEFVPSALLLLIMISGTLAASAYAGANYFYVALAQLGCIGVLALVFFVSEVMKKWNLQGLYLVGHFIIALALCFAIPLIVGAYPNWPIAGPLLLFLGLLTIVNAPFDWLSLGLTRALLRRGLEKAGWWPFALAVVDAVFATLIVAMLAMTMVVAAQAFDIAAVLGRGGPVLDLGEIFLGLYEQPQAPEYWWIYALLLSTLVPSVINLVIGGASLTRGIPWLTRFVLSRMPLRGGVKRRDRPLLAAILTAQMFGGAALGLAAQAVLAVVVIGYVLPAVGLNLLDLAVRTAEFNLPFRAIALLFPWLIAP